MYFILAILTMYQDKLKKILPYMLGGTLRSVYEHDLYEIFVEFTLFLLTLIQISNIS
jgi:hypothetical protein